MKPKQKKIDKLLKLAKKWDEQEQGLLLLAKDILSRGQELPSLLIAAIQEIEKSHE